jgi:putative ABC transport system substrate-binding protein
MDRRACLLGCTALGVAHAAAWAQAGARRRIAVLNAAAAAGMQRDLVDQIREGLAEFGWVDGRDIELHFRFAEGHYERIPGLLEELLRLEPVLLVAAGPRPAIVARDAQLRLPVVAAAIDDPVLMGLAESHARPGRNFTGVSSAFDGVLQRRLQLIADVLPGKKRFAVLFNPLTASSAGMRSALSPLASAFGAPVFLVEESSPADFDAAFKTLARERVDGLVLQADAMIYVNRHDLSARCQALKLPSVWGHRGYLDAGGVASYQGDFRAAFRRSTYMVDRILRGTPPGEIPFEQVTKFELALNLRAARALGLAVPLSVRIAADEVIE